MDATCGVGRRHAAMWWLPVLRAPGVVGADNLAIVDVYYLFFIMRRLIYGRRWVLCWGFILGLIVQNATPLGLRTANMPLSLGANCKHATFFGCELRTWHATFNHAARWSTVIVVLHIYSLCTVSMNRQSYLCCESWEDYVLGTQNVNKR